MNHYFKRILYSLSAISLLFLINSKPAFAQAHLVYGEVRTSVGSIPTYANLSFWAYITARPGDILTKTSAACGYNDTTGSWWVQCASFSSWSPGETLHVDFEDAGSGETGFTEIVLNDAAGQDAGLITLSGVPPVSITTTALPDGQVDVYYSVTLTATAGTTPYTWSIIAGSLPPGLSLNSATGVISGTPTTAGTYNFTVKVVDSSVPQTSDTKDLSITINPPGVLPLTITTTFLPDGYIGVAYSQAVNAIGGTPFAGANPYRWSIQAGSLPPGLTINSLTGEISGTPTTIGTFSFTVKVTDSVNNTDTQDLSITIRRPRLRIITEYLPDGYQGIAYSETLAAIGGVTPYSWSIILGSLPPGLSLDHSTGVISGIPDTLGKYSFKVQVTDSDSPQSTDEKTFSITIKPQMLTICTIALPDGWVGIPYSQTLCAAGGVPPYKWSIAMGYLPPGLTLDSLTGVISGVPTTAASYTFMVKVTDATPYGLHTKVLSIVINTGRPVTIITDSLPDGYVGVPYSQIVEAVGGTIPYTWSIPIGNLPPGLTIDPLTGVISGTPTTEGIFSFIVEVKDAENHIDTKVLSITVKPAVVPPLTIITDSLPDGCVAVSYSAILEATGGVAPYTWSIAEDNLPPGLTLNSVTGVISGTPTTAGTYGFTVMITDSDSPPSTDTKILSITIHICVPGLIITTDSLPDGWVCLPYSATLTAAGGTTPYTWSIALGSLPPGLTLNSLTGVISGTPTQEGAFYFTARVIDSSSPPDTNTKDLSITIHQNMPNITTESLPDGWVGIAYSETLTAVGGAPPYIWTIAACNLPPGLSLDSLTGVISGTPVVEGIYCFILKIIDSCNPPNTDTTNLCITIHEEGRLRIITDSLPDGWVGTAYSETVKATGGVPPYMWSVETCALPPGLGLDSLTGVISGIPTTQGEYCFAVKVIDFGSPQSTDTKNLKILVKSPLKIITDSLCNGWINVTYSETLAASGGVTPYTWSIEAGGLPPGLALDSYQGTITGIPTEVGKYDFTVKVMDSDEPPSWDIKSFSIITNVDVDPPTFSNTTVWSNISNFSGPYPVHSIVTDALSGVDSVFLSYRFDEGNWTAKLMTLVDSFYQAEIPQVSGTTTKIDYYLKATDLAGNTATDPDGAPVNFYSFTYYVGIEEKTSNIPIAFTLTQNVPDPFVSNTVIAYELPLASRVNLRIYNSSGQLIRTLIDTKEEAGHHKVTWNRRDDSGKRVSSGIYFYKLDAYPVYDSNSVQVGNFTDTKKMIVIE
ncbi:MAG TPA: hypothetical protein EYP60_00330 [bacterium (Candidatus Stahlbacteria)]|nr:hypothetical protein [Candidatus Stahlbacteria bacterium]